MFGYLKIKDIFIKVVLHLIFFMVLTAEEN